MFGASLGAARKVEEANKRSQSPPTVKPAGSSPPKPIPQPANTANAVVQSPPAAVSAAPPAAATVPAPEPLRVSITGERHKRVSPAAAAAATEAKTAEPAVVLVREGWLHKKGAIFTGWKKRWFRLTIHAPPSTPPGASGTASAATSSGAVFSYYDKSFGFDSGSLRDVTIGGGGAKLIRTQTDKPYSFALNTPDRVWVFGCVSEADVQLWWSAFQRLITHAERAPAIAAAAAAAAASGKEVTHASRAASLNKPSSRGSGGKMASVAVYKGSNAPHSPLARAGPEVATAPASDEKTLIAAAGVDTASAAPTPNANGHIGGGAGSNRSRKSHRSGKSRTQTTATATAVVPTSTDSDSKSGDTAAGEDDTALPIACAVPYRVLMSGFLSKRGGFVKSWKRRYFRLTVSPNRFEYFEHEPKGDLLTKPKGSVDIESGVEVSVHASTEPATTPTTAGGSTSSATGAASAASTAPASLTFSVRTSQRVWLFLTANATELREWMDAFQRCTLLSVPVTRPARQMYRAVYAVMRGISDVESAIHSDADTGYTGVPFLADSIAKLDGATRHFHALQHNYAFAVRLHGDALSFRDILADNSAFIEKSGAILAVLKRRAVIHSLIRDFQNFARQILLRCGDGKSSDTPVLPPPVVAVPTADSKLPPPQPVTDASTLSLDELWDRARAAGERVFADFVLPSGPDLPFSALLIGDVYGFRSEFNRFADWLKRTGRLSAVPVSVAAPVASTAGTGTDAAPVAATATASTADTSAAATASPSITLPTTTTCIVNS